MLSRAESETIPTGARTALTPTWVVVGLAMGPAVSSGLARSAYGLLLPSMRADLGWDFAQSGAMSSAIAIGYLAGALMTAPLGRWTGVKRLYAIGLALCTLAIAASGVGTRYSVLLMLRVIAGLTGAFAFISGTALTAAAAAGGGSNRAPTFLGIYFSGGGLGIVGSAVAVPPLLDAVGWRGGWLVLGALALGATVFGCCVLRRSPEPASSAPAASGSRWSPRLMAPHLLAYGLFGAGYFAYVTFIVAYLRSDEGFSAAGISLFWSMLGLASVAAVFLWGPILGRLKGGKGAAATIGVVMIGAAIPLVWSAPGGAYLSAVIFGGSFLSVGSAVVAFARRVTHPHAWTATIATLIVAFGLGQCLGPFLSGALSDGPSGIRAGLWLAVGLLATGSLVAMLQNEPCV